MNYSKRSSKIEICYSYELNLQENEHSYKFFIAPKIIEINYADPATCLLASTCYKLD